MQKSYQKPKKLNYQLQEMAFQKYPFQINNKPFFCFQSYYEDQLLNGIDLQLQQAKGMSSQPQKVTYMPPSQQLVLVIGSNIICFNTQKRFYSLLSEVNGYVQLLRSYNCKINNKNYLFWLQSDEEGKNKQNSFNHKKKQQKKSSNQITSNTSMSNLLINSDNILQNDKKLLLEDKDQSQEKSSNYQVKKRNSNKHKTTIKGGVMKKIKNDEIGQLGDKITKKSPKNVNFQIPNLIESFNDENQISKPIIKKRMRIVIFDYEKKKVIHKQPIQIQQQQTIEEIIFYCTPEKVLGYVINEEKGAKVYYRRITMKDNMNIQKSMISRKYLHKKDNFQGRVQRFYVTESEFEIKNLKYNGETDLYLFKHQNTIYTLELTQGEFEIGSTNFNKRTSFEQTQKNNDESQHSLKIQQDEQSVDLDGDRLSKSILQASQVDIKNREQQKYKVKVCSQISITNKEKFIDFSINQVYLVLLTNKSINFYSVFNLNTMIFKFQLPHLLQYPPLLKIEMNKSYLILIHEKSTYISLFTILQRNLKYNTTCEIEIEHCERILKLFMNNYNCEVTVLAKQFEIQGRMTNIIKSKKMIINSNASFNRTFIDVSLAYVNFSSTKVESKPLYLKQQKFKNMLTCKWNSEYLIETENQIIAKNWRESFENLKCACLHPTGQYLIIGFNDCFKVYALTYEGLQNTYMSDGVKQCQSIAYSDYGEHFAVGSANSIGIYNSYNCRKRQTIIFPVGTLVQSLEYRSNHLICILKNKRIVIYHVLLQYKQIFTFNPKNYINQNKHEFTRRPGESMSNLMALAVNGVMPIQINSLFYDINLNVVIFSSGKKLFFLNTLTNQSLGNFSIETITCMEYSQYLSTLFLGTATGEVIAFPWPNKPSNILDQLPRFKFHSEKVIKIKLTPDYRFLMTIASDMSMYKSNVSYILNLKRLKGNEICEYRGNKSSFNYNNFLYNRGFYQFSHPQNIQKMQTKKQYEQEVVNIVFMLPEQRYKQKQNLFSQLQTSKNHIVSENRKAEQPLQIQSLALRNNVIKIKEQYKKLRKQNLQSLERQKSVFKEQTSQLLKVYSELNSEHRTVKIQLNQQIQKAKYQNHKKYQEQIKKNQQQFKQLEKKLNQTNTERMKTKNNFIEIQLIEQEKQKYLESHLQTYVKQIEVLGSKNGQLSCQNSTLEKEILMLKYRIQQLKFVCMNSNESIEKLTKKQQKQSQQKVIFGKLLLDNAKVDVSEMQKKYIKATKQLIEKNKQIDIKLIQYEKEREILVKLQKTVEKTEVQIDAVVDDLAKEKQFMRQIRSKLDKNTQKLQQLNSIREKKKVQKNKTKLQLKKFLQYLGNIEQQLQSHISNNITKEQISYELRQLLTFFQKSKEDKKQQKNKNIINLTKIQNIDEKKNRVKQFRKQLSSRISNKSMTYFNQKNLTETFNQNKKEDQQLTDKSYKLNFTQRKSNPNPLKTQRVNFRSTERNINKNNQNRYFPLSTEGNQTSRKMHNNQTSEVQYQIPISYEKQEKVLLRHKQDIIKKLSNEQKIMSNIKNQRVLFTSIQNKLYTQNQDLIGTYNSLSFDNKYLRNILQVCQNNIEVQDKHRTNKSIKQFSKQTFVTFENQVLSKTNKYYNQNEPIQNIKKKLTPFEKYLASKQKKVTQNQNTNKTNRNFLLTQRQGAFCKKGEQNQASSSQKRIKTVPCVEYKI